MEAEFARDVLTRLPLAEAVLRIWRWVADPLFLLSVFARHGGAGYEKEISFGVLVQLSAEALVEPQGSGRKSFARGRAQGRLTATPQAASQKLGRVALGLREAWLAESTARVRPIYPSAAGVPLPSALQGLEVMVVDGKAIKRGAKRLKPLQGRKGGVLGGKAVVALELRSGLAVAMATHPDGEPTDAKLVPAWLPQGREYGAGGRLWVADRQFCDLPQTAALALGADHLLVRSHPKTHCCPEATRLAQAGQDAHGRGWGEDWGWWGCEQAKQRRFGRRIPLVRPGEETLSLLPDLRAAVPSPANDRVALYLARWSIERVFQQIPEVVPLQTLIGPTPQGTVFPLAFCLLLYTLVHVVRAYVATAHARPVATLSTELLFEDVHRQLVALSELVPAPQIERLFVPLPSAECLRTQLTSLRVTVWTPRGLNAPAKKRKAPTPRTPIPGHQTSVYRLINTYHKQRVNHSSQ